MRTLDQALSDKKGDILFKTDIFEYVKYKDFEFIHPKSDSIYIIPLLLDQYCVLLMEEEIPSYQYKDEKPNTAYLTVMSAAIKEDEDIKGAIQRKLRDSLGVSIMNNKILDFEGPYKLNKDTAQNAYLCVAPLYNSEFVNMARKIDEFESGLNRIVKVSFDMIGKLEMSDILSKYLIDKVNRKIDSYI